MTAGILGAASGVILGSGLGKAMQEIADYYFEGECTSLENATESGSIAGAIFGAPVGAFIAESILPKHLDDI